MVTEKLLGEDLLELQNEKGNPCLSMIVPTHRLAPGRMMDHTILKKMKEQARQLLQETYGEKTASSLIHRVDELTEGIDFDHNLDGLGIYVSPRVMQITSFPFPVTPKVVAADSFEIRDLLYKVSFSTPYFVLVLTEKGARYFEGRFNELTEVRDKNFPERNVDDYLYNKPSRSTSYAGNAHEKSVEKDKSILEELRLKNFFHQIDQRLSDYLIGNTPLLVVGTKEKLGHFADVTRHARFIAGTVTGSYGMAKETAIAELVWPVMHGWLQEQRKQWISTFEEEVGANRGASGIQSAWSIAMEGRAQRLLVEKDFRCPGFVSEENSRLYLRKPEIPHRLIPDAVDDLIEMVLEKKGEVTIVDNGDLAAYEKVALITRY